MSRGGFVSPSLYPSEMKADVTAITGSCCDQKSYKLELLSLGFPIKGEGNGSSLGLWKFSEQALVLLWFGCCGLGKIRW